MVSMKMKMLATTSKLRRFALRGALFTVTIPLWLASASTWRLEAWRSRLRTTLDAQEGERK